MKINTLLYRLAPEARFFWVNDSLTNLTEGNLDIFTLDGQMKAVNEAAISDFEITQAEAKERLYKLWNEAENTAAQRLQELGYFVNFFENHEAGKKELVDQGHQHIQHTLSIIEPYQQEMTNRKLNQFSQQLEQLTKLPLFEKIGRNLKESMIKETADGRAEFDMEQLAKALEQLLKQIEK